VPVAIIRAKEVTMRRDAWALLAVAVMGLLLGCGKGPSPNTPTVSSKGGDATSRDRSTPSPKIWADDDAINAIKVLGYPEAYVYRWQGGVPDGWVEFDAKGGPQREQLAWCRTIARQSMDRSKADGLAAAERFSGLVVVALQNRGKGVGSDYDCSIGFYIADQQTKTTLRTGPIQGQVKLARSASQLMTVSEASSTDVSLYKDLGGKRAKWLELRLVDPGS
jgi:hypothetical protein